jgi:hypothetical protein
MSALKADLEAAVVQLRAAEARLSRTVAVLEAAGVWSGADAKRFQTDWADRVQRPLLVAAGALESTDFIPFS